MALKLLHRGHSSRLETLIEKIQQSNYIKDSPELYSSQTSSSFPSEGFATPNSFIHDQEMPEKDKLDENDRNNNENGENFKLKYERSGNKTKIGKDGCYQCQFCDKSFPRLGYLKKHEQSHAEHMPFKCDYCARLFKHKRSRDRHTKLHTGDRRYRCPQCESAFSRSDHLKIHRKTHDKNKPFQCIQCNRGYNTAAALTSHMQNHKKQAALGNHSAFTYSPRSTGSASSNNSHKRKYSTTLLENKSQRSAPTTPSAINLSCFYCTKSDFASIEQLNLHINTMHSNKLMTNATELQFRIQQQQHKAFYENFQISCEFCTMKFQTVEKMFEHIKHSHLDRINSPNHYLEYFNRNLCSTYGFNGGLEGNVVDVRPREIEKLIEPTKEIKLENEDEVDPDDSRSTEDLPTDLSQPKIKKFKEERKTETDVKIDDKKSPTIPTSPDRRSEDSIAPPTAFLCNQCNASLPDFESFRMHLRSHLEQTHNPASNGLKLMNGTHSANNYVCHQCGLTLDKKSDYEHHIEQHFTIINTEFLCQFCNKFFPKTEELQKHLNDNHVETIYKCSLCKEVFETKISIQLHFAVQHTNETKLYRCSVCMDVFRLEKEFRHHVRTRHLSQNSIQCVFCRVVCSTELEMHFHLAAHVKQYRCPACSESFHVEFLLDRHLQTHHSNKENGHNEPSKLSPSMHASSSNNEHAYNHLIKNSNFYNYQITNKFYHNPHGENFGANKPQIPASTSALMFNSNLYDSLKTSGHLYSPPIDKINRGDYSKSKLLSFYGSSLHHQQQQEILANKLSSIYSNKTATEASEDFFPRKTPPASTVKTSLYLPPVGISTRHSQSSMLRSLYEKSFLRQNNDRNNNVSKVSETENNHQIELQKQQHKVRTEQNPNECGMCERNDFASEIDLQTHRKIAHNLKTGVSLKCAYCSGDYRSRTELENHMKVQHNIGGKHKCLICDEILPSPAVLAEHKLQHCKVGASGKCSLCSFNLRNINDFKEHLKKHTSNEIPMQCVCCRQILNSEFEITLHAKFHTKSAEVNEERTCALCLEVLPTNNGKKICEVCIKKHNFTNQTSASKPATNTQINAENIPIQCNLCKKVQPNSIKLQQHLIDHEFYNSNGYSCYICTSIFTSAAGLQQHIHQEHENSDKDSNTKPYDCNVCEAKFFFRTELEHHQLFHVPACGSDSSNNKPVIETLILEDNACDNEIKQEITVKDPESEEYIEVELVK